MESITFILAGGSGTRLAPLSLNLPGKLPKQFLKLKGERTMLQEAILRLPTNSNIWVVPEISFTDETHSQAKDINVPVKVLSEPFGCNTAPAILLSALVALNQTGNDNTVLFFMPADHFMDKTAFQKIYIHAIEVAYQTDKIVTIGITPTRPETAYGYIKTGSRSSSDSDKNRIEMSVKQFVEKPDTKTANQYLQSGYYFWNAGIFCMKIKTLLNAMKAHAPDTYTLLHEIKDDLRLEKIAEQYTKIKEAKLNISIDYAIMEKEAANILLIPADPKLDWNDVGGWLALEKYLSKDDQHNAFLTPLELKHSTHNTILNYMNINITLINCNNLLLITTHNGILITDKSNSVRAKEIIPGIKNQKTNDLIDCENVKLDNKAKMYIGIIGLSNLEINYSGSDLIISH